MKKMKLKVLQLGATEVLTRTQLKNVLGGYIPKEIDSKACHSKAECTNSSNNGAFFGNCPSAPDLPAGCKCNNYDCP